MRASECTTRAVVFEDGIYINNKPHSNSFKVYRYTSMFFDHLFSKESNYHDFLFASLGNKTLQKGFTLDGKNLLLVEQILSFKSRLS